MAISFSKANADSLRATAASNGVHTPREGKEKLPNRGYSTSKGARATTPYPNQTFQSEKICQPANGTLMKTSKTAMMRPQHIEYGIISCQELAFSERPAVMASATRMTRPSMRGAIPSTNPYVTKADHKRNMTGDNESPAQKRPNAKSH